MRRFKVYRETTDHKTWKLIRNDDLKWDYDSYYYREPRITSWKNYRKTQYKIKKP